MNQLYFSCWVRRMFTRIKNALLHKPQPSTGPDELRAMLVRWLARGGKERNLVRGSKSYGKAWGDGLLYLSLATSGVVFKRGVPDILQPNADQQLLIDVHDWVSAKYPTYQISKLTMHLLRPPERHPTLVLSYTIYAMQRLEGYTSVQDVTTITIGVAI